MTAIEQAAAPHLGAEVPRDRPWSGRLRILHRTSALILLAFLTLHMANHSAALGGQARHVEFMAAVRPLYRNRVVEPVLLALLAVQLLSGLAMIVRGWRRRRGVVAWAQAGSGLYLAAFLLNHVGSVLYGRAGLGLDTNFNFAAAGLHVPGLALFFAPYYFLAVAALFTHLGCAAYWATRSGNTRLSAGLLIGFSAAGAVFGLLVVAALSGSLYPVEIPENYLRTYQ